MKLKVGDEIIVTRGKDHGKHGKVEKILPNDNAVLVPGLNVYKKHVKAQNQNTPGGIIDIVKPLSLVRVALVCPKCGKQTRIGYLISDTKKATKVRICRKCGKEI